MDNTIETHKKPATPIPINKADWFPGLNALRFFAAAIVILMHIHSNQGVVGLPQLPSFAILFKGLYGVSFFFVLSGFLITYLLLKENKKTGSVNVKQFYLRRVFRIWPLYFIVVAAGMFFYWQLAPSMGLKYEGNYSHSLAIVLYSFFLANVMNSLYHAGGILHVTWSVAVEEQFYLFWAPLVKKYIKHLPLLITIISVISLVINMLNTLNVLGLSDGLKQLIATLQFHYMGIGSAFAWLAFHKKDWLMQLPFFTNRLLQALLAGLILCFFFFYQKNTIAEVLLPLPIGILFGWLIVNVSINKRKLFSLEHPVLHYLGKISYGVYMYHMFVVYAVSFLFLKFTALQQIPALYFFSFYGLVFVITIALASLSFFIVEQPVLKLNKFFQLKNKQTAFVLKTI